jgi:hypothetical protein
MQHIHAYKLAATYKMILMYFLVNIYINNQSILYKVNNIMENQPEVKLPIHCIKLGIIQISSEDCQMISHKRE